MFGWRTRAALLAGLYFIGCSNGRDSDNGKSAVMGGSGTAAPGGSGALPGQPAGGVVPGAGGSTPTKVPTAGTAGGATPAQGNGGPPTGGGRGGEPGGDPTPPAADPTGWYEMGYSPRNTYWNPTEKILSVENAASIELKWTFTVSGYPPGSPAVAEGKVFVLATGGLYAINLADGKEAWSKLDIKGTSSVAYDNGFIYVHSNPQGQLYKLKAADGTIVWGPLKSYDAIGGTDGTSSPTVAGGKVMVGHSTTNEIIPGSQDDQTNARGGVFAVDIETGMEAWHYYTVELPENGAMVWSSVSVDLEAGIVYAATGNNYTVGGMHSDAIHAIDLATGTGMWSHQVRAGDTWTLTNLMSDDTDFGANPIIADVDGKKLVAAGDKGSAFWALDRTTGAEAWNYPELSKSHGPANGGVLNNGAFDGEAFYVISNDPTASSSVLHKLNATDGKDAWPPKTFPKITWGLPSGGNGLLVVPVDDDLVILNAATGDELKRFATGGSIAAGAAAIAEGNIVVQSGLQYPLGTVKNNNQVHCYGIK